MRAATGVAAALVGVCTGCLDTQPDAPGSAALRAWDAGVGSDKPPLAARLGSGGRAAVAGASGSPAKLPPDAQAGGSAAHSGEASLQPSAAGAAAPAVSAGSGGHASAGAATPSEPTPMRAGDLVITELMIDPQALSDTQGEWLELYNPGASPLSLRDCKLDDGVKSLHAIAMPGPWLLQPGAYLTIARSSNPGFTPSATAPLSLTNSADSLAIICGSREIDRVSYDKAAGFPLASGASLSLDPDALSAHQNDDPSAWCTGASPYNEDLGSPGRANPRCHDEPAQAPEEPQEQGGDAGLDEG